MSKAQWVNLGCTLQFGDQWSQHPLRAITEVIVDCFIVFRSLSSVGIDLGVIARGCGKLQLFASDSRIFMAWTTPRGRKQHSWALQDDTFDKTPQILVFRENIIGWRPPPKPPIVRGRLFRAWNDVLAIVPQEPKVQEDLIAFEMNSGLATPSIAPVGFLNPPHDPQAHDGFARDQAVRKWALERANWGCEACEEPAPFVTDKGEPYLEVHHIHRLADGGPDIPSNVAALCPNCHREIHYGAHATEIRDRLTRKRRFENS